MLNSVQPARNHWKKKKKKKRKMKKKSKKGLNKNHVEVAIPISKAEIKVFVWNKITIQWQGIWNTENKGNHLYQIQQKVREGPSLGKSRRERCLLNRIRLGHTRLNPSLHVMGKHPTGHCDIC